VSGRHFLGISTKQLKWKTLLAVTFSLLVLQIAFVSKVSASTNPNDGTVNQTITKSISSVALPVLTKTVIPVTGVEISKSSLEIKVKSSATLKATLIPSNATNKNVYWDSSNTAIATVGLRSGRVSALKVGNATITVYTEDGNITEVCEVNIYNPDIITFNDINLEKAVRESINQPTGDLLKNDVKEITNLNLGDNSIYDIGGIENLRNLRSLNLSSSDPNQTTSNQISDISDLKRLTKLTSLRLNNNPISDFSILKNLSNLTSLNLSGTQIDDISLLEELTKLTNLNLSENQISDISILKKLTKLTNLYLDQNEISNINPLKVSTKLKVLSLRENPISESDKKSLRNALYKCKISF